MAGLLESHSSAHGNRRGFETIKTIRINMTKRPSTTTGAGKGSGGKPAAGKAKRPPRPSADAEDGSEETEAGRPQLSRGRKGRGRCGRNRGIRSGRQEDRRAERDRRGGRRPGGARAPQAQIHGAALLADGAAVLDRPRSTSPGADRRGVCHHPGQSRRRLRDERLESEHLRRPGEEGRRRGPLRCPASTS